MNIYNILSLENLYNKKYSYFSTPAHHILGLNYISTICTPASDWQKLHEDIERKFLNIKKHSCVQNSNPIMIGCIPFDTNQPCSLHFYEDHINSKGKFFSNVTDSKVPKLLKKQSLVDVGKFKNTVEKCKSKFQNTKLEKIVLSQAIDYWFEAPLQPECFIRNLLQKNSNAYNFILPLKDCSFIFGASPELLISKQGNYIHSNPLAGSRSKNNVTCHSDAIKQQLLTSKKDQFEHSLVIDFISEKLQPLCENFKVNSQPEILETSTMFHLSSHFYGTLNDASINAMALALKLHPTPAICGAPTELSKKIILSEEGYNREYYTGVVGWMDSEGNGEWVVTIRCGLVDDCKLRLYAGAGIVPDSNASAEWQETEDKMQTLLNLFNCDNRG